VLPVTSVTTVTPRANGSPESALMSIIVIW
jgi:hypothetical protein